MGWKLVRENSYMGDEGEVLHFKLLKKNKVRYKVLVEAIKDGEVVFEDEQEVSPLVGKGLEKINDAQWVLFMSEYYKRWKE